MYNISYHYYLRLPLCPASECNSATGHGKKIYCKILKKIEKMEQRPNDHWTSCRYQRSSSNNNYPLASFPYFLMPCTALAQFLACFGEASKYILMFLYIKHK